MENMSAFDGSAIEGGFTDPVFDAQFVFDAVMNAMARPGTIAEISGLGKGPAPINSMTAAILLTLCDSDTPVWCDTAVEKNGSLRDWIVFQTGAPTVDYLADAHFAVITNPALIPDLATLSQGTQDYPDRSTTLIIQVEAINKNGAFNLKGPGIESSITFGVNPLSPNFLDQWTANNQRFPRGVDVIFVSSDQLVCLPRTTLMSKGAA